MDLVVLLPKSSEGHRVILGSLSLGIEPLKWKMLLFCVSPDKHMQVEVHIEQSPSNHLL